MRPWRFIGAAAVVLGLACAGVGPAQPATPAPQVNADLHIGDLALVLPDGWTIEPTEGASKRLAHPSGWNVLTLGPVAGAPRSALTALLPSIAPGVDREDWRLKEGFTTQGLPVVTGQAFAEFRGVRSYLVPVAFEAGGQTVVLVGIWLDGYPKEEVATLGALLGGVHGPAAGFASPGDRALDGFYVGFGTRTSVSAAATVVAEAGTRSYTFLPDGRYAFSDVAMVDPDGYCARYPKSCGRYAVQGGTIGMIRSGSTFFQNLAVGTLDQQPLSVAADALTIGSLRYDRVPPAHGQTFRGHYTSVSGGSQPDFSVFAQSDLVFARDGRFTKGGRAFTTAELPGFYAASASTQKGRPGRYRVEGYELVLTFDDGTVERAPFFTYKGLLVIDGSPYTKGD